MELGGVDPGADPEGLDRAAGRRGQQEGVPREVADRLLVPGERIERGRQPAQQRIPLALRGERDGDRAHRLGVPAVDDGSLVAADGPDAVARPEEREVLADHLVEQPPQIGLHPALDRRFRGLRVAGVERPAAQEEAGPVPEVDAAQRPLLQPDAAQVPLTEPGEPEEQLVLVVCGGILGAGSQQEERLHKIMLIGPGPRSARRQGRGAGQPRGRQSISAAASACMPAARWSTSASRVGSATSPMFRVPARETTATRSAWCSPISASEYSAATGTPSTRTGRRGPGTLETFSAKDRGWARTCSAKRLSRGGRARRCMTASSRWAPCSCLRPGGARRMAARRSSGSAEPSGRSRQKNESRLPGWPPPSAGTGGLDGRACRLTGNLTRTPPRRP